MTDDAFVTHRGLPFTVAYEMLGSAADAEDVVQETWLRWADVDQAEVRDPRSYLVRIVTRQALNRLRSVSRRREDYVGEDVQPVDAVDGVTSIGRLHRVHEDVMKGAIERRGVEPGRVCEAGLGVEIDE